MKRLLLFLLILFILAPILAHIPISFSEITYGSFTINPIEDTCIKSNAPNTQTWSSLADLQLLNTTSGDSIGYYKFNMTTEYVGAINVTSALLRWHMSHLDFGSVGTVINVWNTNNESWFDHNITYNNAPPLNIIEVYDTLSTGTPQYYSFWIPSSDNTTQGLGAIQNAYNNNQTRTFCLGFYLYDTGMEWSSTDSTTNKPTLTIAYTQTSSSEDTMDRPSLTQPTTYDLIFYAKEDAVVNLQNPSTNYGSENISQIQEMSGVGHRAYVYLKFNFTLPDRINGDANTENYSMTGVNWIGQSLIFKQYCQFAPTDPSFDGWNSLDGIPRANETSWNQTGITWNNRPSLRGLISEAQFIYSIGWKAYDISTEENYIRFSIANGYTYSIVHKVDDRISRQTYNNWIMSEYNALVPYIEIVLASEPSVFVTTTALTWTTAPTYLARSWSLTPFIAGNLLSAMIYTVTVVPISFILKKGGKGDFIKWTIIVANFVFLTLFTVVGWLNPAFYVILLIFTILLLGGVLKR